MAKPGQNSATREQIEAFAKADWEGPVCMINLLKFKPRAEAEAGIAARSGRDLYREYGRLVRPFLEKVGGRVICAVAPQHIIIGDDADDWDEVLVVEYPSRDAFFQMISIPGYPSDVREKALARSALIASKKTII